MSFLLRFIGNVDAPNVLLNYHFVYHTDLVNEPFFMDSLNVLRLSSFSFDIIFLPRIYSMLRFTSYFIYSGSMVLLLFPNRYFQVLSADGDTEVGKITKQWSGLGKEMFSDAENFGVSFPIDLDVKMKAVLLAAVFLVDFMFFETDNE